ncbi:fungal specific transcription factor domain-containing protein [Phlyctema vagabunda]|uniref:Fungal specific transcription factor domain-containing protein n=1 Tax=Phlyctema vagabunda TaxID=108571 RepID=A0ABR4PG11_9HELO
MSNRLQVDDREARRILRQRQKKTRTRTSCYPCQTRKVRCNKEQPCKNCAQRGYPELCTFSSPELGGMNIEATPIEIDHHTTMHDNATVNGRTLESNNPIDTHPQENDDASHFDNEMASPNSINPPVQYHQTSDNNEVGKPANNASRNTHYLGQNSIPNFIREQSGSGLVPKERTPIGSIEDAIMPMLGLQESASSYPFLISPSDANDPSLALPNSRELIRCFECYRTHVHLYTPLLCDVIEFEQDLCRYIAGRSDSATSSEQPRSGNAIAWLGLLFAVVASGTQFSDADVSTRGPKSRTFVRIAFHCLRLANFLTRPSITCLQALLIIGNVLQNNSEPEGAWMLLGTTARMGQSLGLHDNLQKRSQQVSTSTGYLLWFGIRLVLRTRLTSIGRQLFVKTRCCHCASIGPPSTQTLAHTYPIKLSFHMPRQ